MKHYDLNNMSKSELLNLKQVLLSEIKERQEIVTEIDKKIFIGDDREFSSSYIPYYRKENEKACMKILDQIELDDLHFFVEGFYETGNNYRRIDYFKDGYKNPLTDMASIYGISVFHLKILLNEKRKKNIFSSERNDDDDDREVVFPLSQMDEFFQISNYDYGYEKAFNNYNYIKNYIYQCLLDNPNATYDDVFRSFYDKQLLVKDKFADISSYLYAIRGDGDLKLSVSNAGLKKNKDKLDSQLTYRQERLIEAIAFGTTLEKLNVDNYEDSKKLLFLPRKK